MNAETEKLLTTPDSAAVFAMALSLWEFCEKQARETNFNISECYNGFDQFMREIMRIANQFEDWSCQHVNFNQFNEVWPYYLGDNFGSTCLSIMPLSCLMNFGEDDCLRVALSLRLPVNADGELPVPIDLTAENPVPGAAFRQFRIQTLRDFLEENQPMPFVGGDDPFDENFSNVYFALYGVESTGLLEHLADRQTYAQVLQLAQKLAPGIAFPISSNFTTKFED